MDGVHDLGGIQGFGPVVPTPEQLPFVAAWQRRIFGIAVALTGQQAVSMDEIRYGRERMEPTAYLASSYFEQWVAAVEMCLAEHGVLTFADVDDAAERMNRGQLHRPDLERPELTARLRAGIFERADRMEPGIGGRFRVGDVVIARNVGPAGHTRLPRYVRGRTGRVIQSLPASALPDRAAHDEGDEPEPAYQVEFDMAALWGGSAEQNSTLRLDMWESYLKPARREERT